MKRTAINLVSVIGGEGLLRTANLAAVVVIARLYGPTVLGTYSTVLAVATVAVMMADNGLQVFSVAEATKRLHELEIVLGQLYVVKTFLFSVMVTVLVLVGMWLKFSRITWILGSILTFRTLLYSYCQLHAGVLKSLDRMTLIGTIQSIHFVVLLIGVGLVFHYSWSITILLLLLVAGQMLELTISGVMLWRQHVKPARVTLSGCLGMLRRSTPVGITYTIAAFILRGDVIVLSILASSAVVGHFAAANMPLVMVYVAAWLFGSVLLPEMVRRSASPMELQSYVNQWVKRLLLALIPLCAGLVWVAPALVRIFYGPAFATTGTLASIMVMAVPFIMCNAVYLSKAIAVASSKTYIGVYLGTAVVALVLDFALGDTLGPVGVASAIVLREIGMFFAFRITMAVMDRYSVAAPEVAAVS
jgi:O-antigen/teichoic acid export membrane protein